MQIFWLLLSFALFLTEAIPNSRRRHLREVENNFEVEDKKEDNSKEISYPTFRRSALYIFFIPGLHYNQNKSAIAILNGGNNTKVQGEVTFFQEKNTSPVEIKGEISGLTPGKHGFHIHEKGNLRNNDCKNFEGHFNPYDQKHGDSDSKERHIGDLGNLIADESGNAKINITDSVITLHGSNSILGRGIVIHQKEDDLGLGDNEESIVTGNAGARLACGIIGIL